MAETKSSARNNLLVIVGILLVLAVAAFIVSQRQLGLRQKGELFSSDELNEESGGESYEDSSEERRLACNDTDEGIAPFWQGTASGKLPVSGEPISRTDRCENKVIVEYYCFDGRIQLMRMNCKIDCKEGACQLQ